MNQLLSLLLVGTAMLVTCSDRIEVQNISREGGVTSSFQTPQVDEVPLQDAVEQVQESDGDDKKNILEVWLGSLSNLSQSKEENILGNSCLYEPSL